MRSLTHLVRSSRQLSRPERALAIRALGWLILSRTALTVVSYRALSSRGARLRPRRGNPVTAEQCANALRRATRVFPVSCLARALAAQCLLKRSGLAADVMFGVRSDPDGRISAHAWTLSGDVPVSGVAEAAGYTPLNPTGTS